MKTLLHFLVLLLVSVCAYAQPQFYNGNTGGSANGFPLNSTTSNKVQWIYGPGIFDDNGLTVGGTPAYNGNITSIFVRLSAVPGTYTNLTVRMAQNVGTITTWPSATFNTGMTTVMGPTTFAFAAAVGGWYEIPLSTPFLYDPALSIAIEIEQSAYTSGASIYQTTTGGTQRIWGLYGSASGSSGTGWADMGFNMLPSGPCIAPPTAGTTTTNPSGTACFGANVLLNLSGNSYGTGQTYQWESSASFGGPFSPVGVSSSASALNITASATLYYRCAVTCGANTTYSNPVLITVPTPFPGGTYTINSALATGGTNFQSFTDAVNAISCGISGPVVFDVVSGSGPYNQQVIIPQIFGASATNTVTFNGNGTTLTSALGSSTLELNGADFIKFNNLIINNTNGSTAFAAHLWNNANNNKFDGCTFTVPIGNTATTSVPFSISGSQTVATTAGASGINDTVINCTISGGYYNTCFIGNSAAVGTGNYLANSTLTEFYLYGSYNLYQNGMVIKSNILTRPTRATVSSTYPIYLSTGMVGTLVEGNKLRNLFEAAPTSTSLCYGIYVTVDGTLGNENKIYNNLIHDNNSAGVYYPIYASGADYIKIYHNTIDINHPTSTATSATYGIYSSGTTGGIDIKNNIVSLKRGGTGARYCLYFTGGTQQSNNNVLLNTSAASATSGIGFYSTAQISMANWQAVNGAIWDQQSVNVDPVFNSPTTPTYDFTPTTSTVNNIGAPVGVTNDINNAVRSALTPDPGAIEFTLSATDIAVINITSPNTSGCYTASEPIVVTIQNAGSNPLDMSLTPVTFTGSVSGAITVPLSGILNSGTLAPNATTTFTLTPNVNMTGLGTYTINISATVTGDGNPANDALIPAAVRTVGTNGGTLTAPVVTYCATGTPSLTLSGASGGTRQWQQSTVSSTGPWTNVGVGGDTYTPGTAVNQTTYFQVESNCNLNTFTSNVLTITVNNPTLTSTTADTVCQNNAATLAATATPGNTIKWYTAPTGGSSVFTGSPFNTPVLNSTTTYYAEASTGGGGSDSVAVPLANGTTTGVYHHMFRMNTVTGMDLTAIGIKCNNAVNTITAWDIYYRPDNYQAVAGANTSAAGWTLLSSVTNVPSAGATDYTIIAFGLSLPIPPNSQYSFYVAPVGAATHQYASTALGTTVASNLDATIIAGNRGSSLFNCTTSGGMAIVKMIYSTGCAGLPRVPVTALVETSPVVTASPSSVAICTGAQTTLSGGGTSGVTYTWSGGITDATPFTVSSSTIYTVTGTAANNCTATATASIIANPVLTGTISASPTNICLGGNSSITATVNTLCLGSVSTFAGLYAPANWSITQSNSNGLVNTGGAPANIIMTTGTNGSFLEGTTSFSKVMTCSGTVSFNWSFTTPDIAFSDRPRYQINNGLSQEVTGFSIAGASSQSGTQTISVNAGDTVKLQAWTFDNDGFAATITYSNFSAPAAAITGTVSIWDAPTGGTNLGTPPYTAAPASAGPATYYAEYTTNGTGCVNLTRTPVTVTVNALPVVTASASSPAICLGSSTVLSGGGASSYIWNGPNADPYTVSPVATTSYTVTGTDGNGCSNTASISVTVNPLPVMTSLTSTPSPICTNGTSALAVLPGITGAATYCASNFTSVTYEFLTNVNFAGINNTSAGNTGGPVNYTAQTGNVVAGVPSTMSVTMDPDASDYIYAWIDWNQNGTLNDAGEEYVIVSNSSVAGPHTLSITPPVTALNGATRMRVMVDYNNAVPNPCRSAVYGEAEDYTINVSGGAAPAPGFASIAWSPATFLNATNTASVTASSVTATTTYTVQGTDANGCTITSSVTLTVTPAPTGNTFATPIVSTLPLSTTGDNLATNCWTSTYTGANAQSSPDVFYQFVMPNCNDSIVVSTCGSAWDTYIHLLDNTGTQIAFSDDDCATASLINYTGLTPGATYYAVVEGFGANTGSYNLNINSYQSAGLVTATVSSSSASPVCENTTVTLTGSGAGVGGSYTYTGPATVTAGQYTATLSSAGTYTVQATTAAGCTATTTITMNVNALPTVTASPTTQTFCQNGMATLTGGGASSYSWSGGITDATPFAVTSTMTYTVTGTDANLCTNTATAEVNMSVAPSVVASISPSLTCHNTSAIPTGSGATTYTWTGGLVDGQAFVATTGTTTYTVTGSDGLGCTATSSVSLTVNPASSDLALATATNAASTTGTTNGNNTQVNGIALNYYSGSCNLIASVNSGATYLGSTTATVNVNPSILTYNGQPYVNRWFQITPTTNGPADITFYLTQNDFDTYNVYATANSWPLLPTGPFDLFGILNLAVTKVDNGGFGNNPLVLSPNAVWNSTTNYWEITVSTPGFSQFYFHSVNPGNQPLSATITNFSGRKLSTSDMLTWTTASEQNNAYFNLQYATDGINFKTIAKVNSQAANGNSSSILNYSYEHMTPSLGHNYYRLEQVDIDNHATLNQQIVDLIWGSNGSTVSIYPNPTKDVLNIDLYTSKVQNTTVKVLDMSGRIIKQIQARSEAGMNKLSISLGDIASGIYTVQIFENDQLTQVSKVKKND